MRSFKNSDGAVIVRNMVKTIQANVDHLSEIDGAIGDGDHGINMNKGFTLCGDKLNGSNTGFSEALATLSAVLLNEIGGSMGPLYGSLFRGMSVKCRGLEDIDIEVFDAMLSEGLSKVRKIGGDVNVGDKTMMDTLIPAVDAFHGAKLSGKNFGESLEMMTASAKAGMESTVDLVAKIGRAARLGERSRGVQDAGATSCFLLLETMGGSIKTLLAS